MKNKRCLSGRLSTKGFTLIELLVVVLIIGILAAVAVPQYQKAVDKAKYTQAMMLGKKIAQAQQQYKLANGVYSGRFAELDIDMPAPTSTRQDSENIEYYFYKWGYCWINGSSYDACLVQLSSSAQAWFYADRHPSSIPQFGFSCWAAPKTSTRANELCKVMTGKSTGRDNGYMVYSF